jgi:transposase
MVGKKTMSPSPNTPRTRRRFDAAFKQDAVNHTFRTGKTIAAAARELGIESHMLARWRRERLQKADQHAVDPEGMKPSELAEQLRLSRLEIEDLREQRDILKKALSILGQMPPRGGQR